MASDSVVDVLLAVARDVFPSMFQVPPPAPPSIPFAVTARVWDHPDLRSVVAAMQDDPDLGLFTGSRPVHIQTNQGLGWPVDPLMLAVSLVTSAATAVVAKGLPTNDPSVFEGQVREACSDFRRLVRGEPVETLVLLGYDGLTLRDRARIDLPWGTLRPAHPLDEGVGSSVPASCVLEVKAELRFRLGEPEKWPKIDYPAGAARAAALLGLAALLGVPRANHLSPAPVWGTSLTPGASGQGGWSTGRRVVPVQVLHGWARRGGEPLSAKEEQSFVAWAELVERHYDDSIEIAVRRIMLALLERGSAADSLIDAVIALENLFGHREKTEVFFRVSTAAAHLLRPAAKRASFRSELRDIYDTRSTVIHGGKIRSEDRLREQSDRAVQIVIDALRVLFRGRPHLISDRERGMRLILGTARANPAKIDAPSPAS